MPKAVRFPGQGITVFGGGQEIRAVCPAITPTVGPTELLTDPGLEAAYTDGLCVSLGKGGSPTVSESADVHGGSKAQQFTATAQNDRVYWTGPAGVVGAWYQWTCWGKRTAGAGGTAVVRILHSGATAAAKAITAAAYTQYVFTARAGTTGVLYLYPAYDGGSSSYDAVIVDDGSLMAITFASCLTYLGARNIRPGTYTCTPTLTAATQCGIAIGYANPTNLVLAYHDGVNAKLDKCVGGTWTSVISGAAAYGAAKVLKVIIAANGTDYALYYDGAQVGVTTAVTDAGLGTGVCGFSALAGNTVGLVTTSGAVV